MEKQFILTKTKYLQFLQCPKNLWMNEHQPNLKKPLSSFDELKLKEGTEVGKIATQHSNFKDGIYINTLNMEEALAQTQTALTNGSILTIYEAAFKVIINGVTCFIRVDVLKKNPDATWDLIEVKSSTKIKDEYLSDIAFQKVVLEKSQVKINKAFLMYVNKSYCFKNTLVPEDYFLVEEVSELLIPHLNLVLENIALSQKIVQLKENPDYPVGTHCYSPHLCPFNDFCNTAVKDSITNLRNLHYKKRELLKEANISSMSQIKNEDLSKFTETQQIQILCARNPAVYHLEREKIKEYLNTLTYPLHFLDFEALLSAIPYFDGMQPQQFVVYQASIHKQVSPNKKPSHACYLHDQSTDPQENILKFLKDNISETGSIIVYHKQFEETQLLSLKRKFPEYGELIDSWVSRLWDLEKIFSNFWYYDNNQEGSTSIKKVSPVLVPKLSYKTLYVKDGNESVANFLKLIKEPLAAEEKNFLKSKLNEYNTLDTLAMVKILNKIKWLTQKVSD